MNIAHPTILFRINSFNVNIFLLSNIFIILLFVVLISNIITYFYYLFEFIAVKYEKQVIIYLQL
jgi:hypothetical protein